MKAKCKIIKKNYDNGDFKIFSCRTDNPDINSNKWGYFSITGNLPYISVGQEVELNLVEPTENNYGWSYKVESCPSLSTQDITPDVAMGIICEITTPTQAKEILSKYPDFIHLVLEDKTDEIDVKKLYNIKEYRLNAYIREVKAKFKYLDIMHSNKEYDLSTSECKTLLTKFGDNETVNKELKDNPYVVLMQILDRDFERWDKDILDKNPALKLSEQRVESLIYYVLKLNENDGSTIINANSMASYAKDIAPELIGQIRDVSLQSELFHYDEITKDISLMSTHLQECEVAEFVKKSIERQDKLDIDWKKYQTIDGFSLTDMQLNALNNLCNSNISLLVGYSGSGKSSTTKAMLSMAKDNNLTYRIVAPTGKAAARVREITGEHASTIHKLCLTEMTINCDLLLVDESSMIDLSVFCMLLRAIENEHIHVCLIGDPEQLPSIGCGRVFKDLIDSNTIPTTMLTEIFRYKDKGTAYVATNIRQGKTFLNGYETQQLSDNYKFIQTDNIIETVVDEYKKQLQYGVIPEDILCLSPYNVKESGSYAISNAIQDIVNPLGNREELTITKSKTKIHFRTDDLVLCKKNDYDATPYDETIDHPIAVFNGEQGKVVKIEDDCLIIDFEGDLVVYNKTKMNNLLLAYSCSIHSSQGSEADVVISITSPQHKRMLNKNICYVASTRSKKKHIEIGDIETMNSAIKIDAVDERKTRLKEMLT